MMKFPSLFKNLTLGVKLSLIVIAAILILVIAIIFVFNRQVNTLTANTNRQRLETLSVRVQRELQENINEVDNAGILTSQAPGVVDATKGNNQLQARLLGASLAQSLNLQDYALINADGDFIGIGLVEENIEEKLNLIQEGQQGEPQLKLISMGSDNLLYIAFAYPIFENMTQIGTVFGARQIDVSLFQISADDDEINFVLWYDDAVLLSTFATNKTAENFVENNIQPNELRSAYTGNIKVSDKLVSNNEGVNFGIAFVPLQSDATSDVKAVLIIEHEFKSIADFQNDIIRNTVLVTIALTMIILVATLIYTHNTLTRPILRVEEQAKYIIAGDYTKRIEVQHTHDFGRVAELINKLTETLQQREYELNDLTEALEMQVEEAVLDLTQAYEQLEQREDYLKNIFANTNDAILIIDAVSHKILDANNKAYAISHYTHAELLNMKFEALHLSDNTARLQSFWERLATEKNARTDKLQWQTKNFPTIDVEISASWVDLNEEQRIIIVAHDITANKQTQEKIRLQNEELRQANHDLGIAREKALELAELKSQFLATMSHELRTPLNAIVGYTEIQLAGMTGELNQEQRDYQQRVLENSEHLLNMINDLLDLTKIESGRVEIRKNPLVIQDLVSSVGYQMKGLAEDKTLIWDMKLDANMPDIIMGDSQRLKQILINLLSNAVKFTEKGSVKLNVNRKDETTWQMIVSDTGVGIPPHAQEYIFDEFRQLDSSSRRQFAGTGLGLAIVKKLVLLMNGKIILKSTVNKGTIFTIELPLISEEEP